jgi:hypothetical protein
MANFICFHSTIYFLFIQIKLVFFFHGLRIYISRIVESYGLAYIFIYKTWITNIERDYWVSTVTVNASSSFPFKSYLWMGLKRNIQDFLDFLVALFSSKNIFAFELYKKLQIIRTSISLKTNNICLLIQIHHLQIIQKNSSSSNPHSLTSNTS